MAQRINAKAMGNGKRISVIFKNGRTGNLWVKSFRAYLTASKASRGITKTAVNKLVAVRPSKGFKYKSLMSRFNKGNSKKSRRNSTRSKNAW